ncbi:hypothetical protein PGT21_005113 [Puccinia graminis f. sp. tritici]|nr:hypothetical protein PGTUg99_019917 [Puccinia graminis f. sp. tritici]KAA1097392.1 hypothetical protein PGT21_005113 [Puccinia graminis f. sp. tritici]KAA1134257.1 hypothetical protein PGTUg99_033974 [Puccinia graminis f. sp. tritici]
MRFSRSTMFFLTASSGLANATGWTGYYDCSDPSYPLSLCSITNKNSSPPNSRVWMRDRKQGTKYTYWCGPNESKHCCPAYVVNVAKEHSNDFSDQTFTLMCQNK